MMHTKFIYVVFKTHFDIGYTELAEEVIERYGKSMLPDVIKTCEGTQSFENDQRYVWTMSAWPLIQSLNPETAEQAVINRAKELINQGQITWHVLPFTTHTEFCGLEEYIRGMYFSRKLSKEYGKWPISAKMTDVPGHTWVLPSLLYKAGVKFLHLGCNPGCIPPDVPRLFYWEGPDGNRVLTFYSKGTYGSSLEPPEDWPYPVWLALMQTNDNIGPQGPEIIEEIIDNVNEALPGTTVVVGTMDDFYRALVQYPLDDIPVVRGDLADTWIHGAATYPAEVGKLRTLRQKLIETEKALSLAAMLKSIKYNGIDAYRKELEEVFERCILFGEHTWGLDVKTTMGLNRHYKKKEFLKNKNTPLYNRMEKSWEEQRQRVYHATEKLEIVSPVILNEIAAHVNAEGEKFIIFNGIGWRRNAWVDLDEFRDKLHNKVLIDAIREEAIEVTLIDGRLKAYVKDLPSFGYKTLTLEDREVSSLSQNNLLCGVESGVLENDLYRIEVDKDKGCISSLIDKSTGKEWVDKAKEYGFGQYRYDIYGIDDITEFIRTYSFRFYDWLVNDLGRLAYPPQKHLIFVPGSFSIDMKNYGRAASLVMSAQITDSSVSEYGNASKVCTQITIYDDEPYIDISFILEGKEETSFIEAGHFVFSVNLANPVIRINKLGSVVDPENDIVKDANNLLYCCENWVDVSDGEYGIAIIPFDTPLFSIGEQAIYRYGREYVKKDPVLLFNAFNNSWGTNFPQWMGGNYAFKYRLIPHQGDWKKGNIAKQALESVIPPLVSFSAGNPVNAVGIPNHSEWIKGLEGFEVLTLKPAEDMEGLVLRLREISAESRKVELTFADKFGYIAKCDLLERVEEILCRDLNRIAFVTRPFEIHTFYLGQKEVPGD